MDVIILLGIFVFVGTFLVGIYLSLKGVSKRTRTIVWIICGLIFFGVALQSWLRTAEKTKQEQADRYDRGLGERTVLLLEGKPATYVDGLGESPLLKDRFNEGQQHEKEYKFKEAIAKYEECLSHPEATPENKVATNILIGNCYYVQSMLKEAERHYREALDISKRVKDETEKLAGRSAALGNIGLVLFDKGDLEGALENYAKAIKIFEDIGQPSGAASIYGNIGLVLADKGDFEGALENYGKVLEIFRKIGNLDGMAKTYGNIGLVLRQKGDLEGALGNHRKSLEITEKLGLHSISANQYGNVGIVLACKGDVDGALESHKKALEINKRIGRPGGMASNYGNIGLVLAEKGDLEGALENYRKSLDITEELGLHSISANQYGNIGIVLRHKGDLEGALENYNKAVDIFEGIGQPASAAHGYINIANIHSQKNDYKTAALLELEALLIYAQIGMKPDVEKAQHNLAISIRKLKEQGKFEEFLQEAKEKFGEEVAQRIKQITG